MCKSTLLAGLGEGFPGIRSFSGGQADKFGASICKSGIDEDRTESLEAVPESTGLMPVVGADIASSVAGNTTAIDDDTEKYEADDCDDLDQAKDELD